jgi:hypothetical protein
LFNYFNSLCKTSQYLYIPFFGIVKDFKRHFWSKQLSRTGPENQEGFRAVGRIRPQNDSAADSCNNSQRLNNLTGEALFPILRLFRRGFSSIRTPHFRLAKRRKCG